MLFRSLPASPQWTLNKPIGEDKKHVWVKNLINYSDGTMSEMQPIKVYTPRKEVVLDPTLITQSETSYNFLYSDSWYKNTNQQQNSTTCKSDFQFTLDQPVDMLVVYEQDSEVNYDYLTINGVSTKGKYNGNVKIHLSSGTTTITIQYSKDGSQSNGTDTAKFKFILEPYSITLLEEQYALSDSDSGLVNYGSWSSVMPLLNNKNKYLWKRERIQLSDSSTLYTDPYLVKKIYINVSTVLNELERTLNTTFGTTSNGWEMMFELLNQNMNQINRYIRFENGNIILGEEGNAVTLKIENDIIAFYQFGQRVAYLSDGKLQVTEAYIRTQLNLGNFAFVPGKRGNLTFKKVVN